MCLHVFMTDGSDDVYYISHTLTFFLNYHSLSCFGIIRFLLIPRFRFRNFKEFFSSAIVNECLLINSTKPQIELEFLHVWFNLVFSLFLHLHDFDSPSKKNWQTFDVLLLRCFTMLDWLNIKIQILIKDIHLPWW